VRGIYIYFLYRMIIMPKEDMPDVNHSAEGFCAKAWEASSHVRTAVNTMPFVQQLKEGTLSKDVFRHYMIQVWLKFCREYCKINWVRFVELGCVDKRVYLLKLHRRGGSIPPPSRRWRLSPSTPTHEPCSGKK